MIARRGAAVLAAAALAVGAPSAIWSGDIKSGTSMYWRDDLPLMIKLQKTKLPRIAKVFERVEFKDGMTVLDIGAGTGQQSYIMAERLKGKGKVVATDIDPLLIDYVNAQAKERGLENLEGVVVSKKGVDPVYGKQRYDLVLFYNVFHHFHDRVAFFSELKKHLNPGARIVVVDPRARNRIFTTPDIKHWQALIDDLRAEPDDSPMGRLLKAPLRKMLDGYPEDKDRVRRAVAYRMNQLLTTPLFEEFAEEEGFKKEVRFTKMELPLALWSLYRMRLAGFPRERILTELSLSEVEELKMFNKLFFIQRYRKHFGWKGDGPYITDDDLFIELDGDAVAADFAAAGYRLDKVDELPPYEAVWQFVPAQ